jgi:isopenicillin-N epimerase
MNRFMSTLRHHFMLDPEITFLNHGSFGACPTPVFEEYQRWQRTLERQPVKLLARDIDGLLREAMTPLAAMLEADAADCVFVPNATTGINIVARSLRLEAGDEVLTTDHEYGACDYTWEYACALAGAQYVHQSLPRPFASAEAFVEALWAGVTPRTRVLFLSHITSPTALTFPIEAVLKRARAEGILTVIDGAHAPGQIPIHLRTLDPDFYTGNFHKWLCAPKSSAFLYARKEHQPSLTPAIISWGWPDDDFALRHERQATRDPSAYLATPAALTFQQMHDWDAQRGRCHRLAQAARLALAEVTGLPPLAEHDGWFAQMIAAELPAPPEKASAIKARLYEHHRVEVPVTFQGGRIYVRASFQAYNDAEDLERLLGALHETLAYVA